MIKPQKYKVGEIVKRTDCENKKFSKYKIEAVDFQNGCFVYALRDTADGVLITYDVEPLWFTEDELELVYEYITEPKKGSRFKQGDLVETEIGRQYEVRGYENIFGDHYYVSLIRYNEDGSCESCMMKETDLTMVMPFDDKAAERFRAKVAQNVINRADIEANHDYPENETVEPRFKVGDKVELEGYQGDWNVLKVLANVESQDEYWYYCERPATHAYIYKTLAVSELEIIDKSTDCRNCRWFMSVNRLHSGINGEKTTQHVMSACHNNFHEDRISWQIDECDFISEDGCDCYEQIEEDE